MLELRFTGRNGTKTVIRVKGERIAPAENRPLTEEQVTKALAKTGNTPFYFETLDVKLEGDCFCPMQQLNTLRRQGIEELEKAVLNGFRRTSADVGQQDMTDTVSDLEKRADNTAGNLRTSVLAETLEQLEAMWEFLESALESSEMEQSLRRIYLDFELFLGKETPEKTREICRKFQQKKIQIFLALPHISRGNLDGKLKSLLLAEKETVDGVLIRNLESLGMLRKIGFDKSVIADHNLYILNHEAKKFLKEEGISEYTASLELNAKELSGLDLTDCEGVVYGYIPVMESAQCLEKTCFGCKKASGRDEMADRLGHRFSMRRVCTFCYNVIYNTDPQVLFSEMDTLRRVKVSSCRLHFTGESKAETKQILSLYTQAYAQDPVWPENLNYTKGHFRRGIK